MVFTFTIADSEDAKRLEEDLREDPRIYTRHPTAKSKRSVGPEFRLTHITVDGRPL
jgi:hypothetical protein